MTTIYAIKGWHQVFENYRSREVQDLRYVSWPTRQDSEAFTVLCRTVDGHAALGMFGSLVQLAARCKPRGVLLDERGPMTPARYAKRYGISNDDAERLWLLLVAEAGWLVPHVPGDVPLSPLSEPRVTDSAPVPQPAAHSAHEVPTDHRRTTDAPPPYGLDGRDGVYGKGKDKSPSAVADLPVGFLRFWAAYPSVRKAAKSKCLGVWRRCKLEPRADEVVKALEGWKQTEQWTKEGGQFVCAPIVWLNQERWENVPSPVENTRQKSDQSKNIAAMEAALNRGKR